MDLLQDIIIGIGIGIGILLFSKTKPIFFRIILIGLIISYGLTFFTQFVLIYLSYWIFGFMSLAFSIYNSLNKKWLNFVIGLFGFAAILWEALNWPFYGELEFLMTIPVVLYILICKNWRENINQLSVLTILAFFEFTLILRLIE